MEVARKVIAVTGGGNGIGREVVLELLRRGARVAAVDLREEALAGTADLAAAGDRLSTHVVDITDRAAVDALPDAIADVHGAVDGVVNVAGIIQPFVRLADLDWDAIERVVDVNLWGTLHVVKAFLPALRERPAAHLVTVSSMGGYLPVPGQTVYGATKAAVALLTEGLYAELLDTRVGVSVVFPGGVSTEITANSGVAIPGGAAAAQGRSRIPTTTPQDAARIICDGIEDDDLHIYVGVDAKATNALRKVAPRRAIHLIAKQMERLLG